MQSGLELWLSPTTGVLSHLHNNYTLSSIFFIFGPSGPGDHTTGSTALNLGMLHACFDQQGAAAISIVETGKTLQLATTTTGSTALNLGMLHACFDQQGAAAISIVETGKTLQLATTTRPRAIPTGRTSPRPLKISS